MSKLSQALLLVLPFACNEALGLDPGKPGPSNETGGKGDAGSKTDAGDAGGAGTLAGSAGGGTSGNGAGGRSAGSSAGSSAEGIGGSSGGEGGESTGGTTSGRSGGSGRGGTGATAGIGGSEAGEGGGGGSSGAAGTGAGPGTFDMKCDQYFDQYDALEEIEGAINSAAGGTVICIDDGATWDGAIAVSNTTPSDDNRVVVCASSIPGAGAAAACGGLGPRIRGGISFDAASDGFVLAGLDLVCAFPDCQVVAGLDLGGASHIRFEGGTITGFEKGVMCDTMSTAPAPCDDIQINETRIDRNAFGVYGSLTNSTFSFTDFSNGQGQVPGSYGYDVYLTSGSSNGLNDNIVFEGSHFNGLQGQALPGYPLETAMVRLAGRNRDIAFRNSIFRGFCVKAVVDCGADGSALDEGCDGVEFHGNLVNQPSCPVVLRLESAKRVRVYNNDISFSPSAMAPTPTVLAMSDGETPAADGWFFNNTVQCDTLCTTPLSFDGTGHRVFNNLFYYQNGAAGIDLITGGDGACAQLGTGGERLENNFLYSTDGSPILPACGTGNSTTFDVLPGFVNSNDTHITSSSAVAGFGTDDGAPETDFDGRIRPSPPSAGAYDVRQP
jgi:hypothetical protein